MSGTVVGVDISVPMLHEARTKAIGQAIEIVAADAQNLPFDAESFDAAICLFGLMFFPDRAAALAGLHRLLVCDGRLVVTAWTKPEETPFAGFVAQELIQELPADGQDLLRPVSWRLPDDLSERLQKLADRTGRSKTYYMVEAINEHLNDLEDLHLAEQRLRSVRAGRMGTVPLDEVMKRYGLEG